MKSDMKEWAGHAAHYQELFRNVVTDKEFQAATQAVLDKAKKEGNVPAFIMICDRLMGKPASAPKPVDDKPEPPPLKKDVRLEVDKKDTRSEISEPRSTAGGPNPSIAAAALNSKQSMSASGSNCSFKAVARNALSSEGRGPP